MKQPIKMTPGDDLHLSLLMAPHSLNLAVGQLREQLLGYGRAAFEAGKAGQCLYQIQEPAPVLAAPAAVAVPGWLEALAESWDGCMYDAPGETIDIGASIRRAALATLPEAAPVVLPEPLAVEKGTQAVMQLVADYTRKAVLESSGNYPEITLAQMNEAWGAIFGKVRALLATATGLPAQAMAVSWKDHHTAQLVNQLRDCATSYFQTQQLRERIATIVAPLCAQLKAHQGVLQPTAPQAQAEPVAWTVGGEVTNWSKDFSKYKTQHYVRPVFSAPMAQADARDAQLLSFLQDQCIDLRCFTTSDGEDVGWRTVQHHMSEPRERVVSEVYGDQPRRAIREAMARIERDPYCTGPLHLEDAAAIAAAKGE